MHWFCSIISQKLQSLYDWLVLLFELGVLMILFLVFFVESAGSRPVGGGQDAVIPLVELVEVAVHLVYRHRLGVHDDPDE